MAEFNESQEPSAVLKENTMENNTITAAPRTRTMAEHLQLMTENIVSQQETQVADTGGPPASHHTPPHNPPPDDNILNHSYEANTEATEDPSEMKDRDTEKEGKDKKQHHQSGGSSGGQQQQQKTGVAKSKEDKELENMKKEKSPRAVAATAAMVAGGYGSEDRMSSPNKPTVHQRAPDPAKAKEREDRIRVAKEKRELEAKKKQEEIEEIAKKKNDLLRQKEEQRKNKLLEMKKRDEEHRLAIEERKRKMIDDEMSKKDALLKKYASRDMKLEQLRNRRSMGSYAFGSSTPRMRPLDLTQRAASQSCLSTVARPSTALSDESVGERGSSSAGSSRPMHASRRAASSLSLVRKSSTDKNHHGWSTSSSATSQQHPQQSSSSSLSSATKHSLSMSTSQLTSTLTSPGHKRTAPKMRRSVTGSVANLHSKNLANGTSKRAKSSYSDLTLSSDGSPIRRARPQSVGRLPNYASPTVSSQLHLGHRGRQELHIEDEHICYRYRSQSAPPVHKRAKSNECPTRRSRTDLQATMARLATPKTQATSPRDSSTGSATPPKAQTPKAKPTPTRAPPPTPPKQVVARTVRDKPAKSTAAPAKRENVPVKGPVKAIHKSASEVTNRLTRAKKPPVPTVDAAKDRTASKDRVAKDKAPTPKERQPFKGREASRDRPENKDQSASNKDRPPSRDRPTPTGKDKTQKDNKSTPGAGDKQSAGKEKEKSNKDKQKVQSSVKKTGPPTPIRKPKPPAAASSAVAADKNITSSQEKKTAEKDLSVKEAEVKATEVPPPQDSGVVELEAISVELEDTAAKEQEVKTNEKPQQIDSATKPEETGEEPVSSSTNQAFEAQSAEASASEEAPVQSAEETQQLKEVAAPPAEAKEESKPAEPAKKVPMTKEEEYKARLAEKRREAREKAQREAEEKKRQEEEAERLEEERIRREEEEQLRFEEESLRLADEARAQEAERLQAAIEEVENRRAEEEARREADRKAKEEAERKAQEEADKRERENEERLRKEEEERQERKKRLEMIMKRVKQDDTVSPKSETPSPAKMSPVKGRSPSPPTVVEPEAERDEGVLVVEQVQQQQENEEAETQPADENKENEQEPEQIAETQKEPQQVSEESTTVTPVKQLAADDSATPKFKSPLLQQMLGKGKGRLRLSQERLADRSGESASSGSSADSSAKTSPDKEQAAVGERKFDENSTVEQTSIVTHETATTTTTIENGAHEITVTKTTKQIIGDFDGPSSASSAENNVLFSSFNNNMTANGGEELIIDPSKQTVISSDNSNVLMSGDRDSVTDSIDTDMGVNSRDNISTVTTTTTVTGSSVDSSNGNMGGDNSSILVEKVGNNLLDFGEAGARTNGDVNGDVEMKENGHSSPDDSSEDRHLDQIIDLQQLDNSPADNKLLNLDNSTADIINSNMGNGNLATTTSPMVAFEEKTAAKNNQGVDNTQVSRPCSLFSSKENNPISPQQDLPSETSSNFQTSVGSPHDKEMEISINENTSVSLNQDSPSETKEGQLLSSVSQAKHFDPSAVKEQESSCYYENEEDLPSDSSNSTENSQAAVMSPQGNEEGKHVQEQTQISVNEYTVDVREDNSLTFEDEPEKVIAQTSQDEMNEYVCAEKITEVQSEIEEDNATEKIIMETQHRQSQEDEVDIRYEADVDSDHSQPLECFEKQAESLDDFVKEEAKIEFSDNIEGQIENSKNTDHSINDIEEDSAFVTSSDNIENDQSEENGEKKETKNPIEDFQACGDGEAGSEEAPIVTARRWSGVTIDIDEEFKKMRRQRKVIGSTSLEEESEVQEEIDVKIASEEAEIKNKQPPTHDQEPQVLDMGSSCHDQGPPSHIQEPPCHDQDPVGLDMEQSLNEKKQGLDMEPLIHDQEPQVLDMQQPCLDQDSKGLDTEPQPTHDLEQQSLDIAPSLDEKKQGLDIEPPCHDEEPQGLNMQQPCLDQDPKGLNMEPPPTHDQEQQSLDMKPPNLDEEKQGLDMEPLSHDQHPVDLEMEPSLDEEKQGLDKEPMSHDKDPVGLDKEPSLEEEKQGLDIEPMSHDQHPVGLEMEPSLDAEKEGHDQHPVGLDKEPSLVAEKQGLGATEPLSPDQHHVGLDMEPRSHDQDSVCLAMEPSLDAEKQGLDMEPLSHDQHPVGLDMEPRSHDQDSVCLAMEPSLDAEKQGLDMEPLSHDQHPIGLDMEPSLDAEKEGHDQHPVGLDKEPSLDAEKQGLDMEPLSPDQDPVALDMAPSPDEEKQGLDMEQPCLDQETKVLDMEPPPTHDQEQLSLDMEPPSLDQEPQGFDNEPSCDDQEPLGLSIELQSYDQEPHGLNTEPSSHVQDSPSHDQESQALDMEQQSHNQELQGLNEKPLSDSQEPSCHDKEPPSHDHELQPLDTEIESYGQEIKMHDQSLKSHDIELTIKEETRRVTELDSNVQEIESHEKNITMNGKDLESHVLELENYDPEPELENEGEDIRSHVQEVETPRHMVKSEVRELENYDSDVQLDDKEKIVSESKQVDEKDRDIKSTERHSETENEDKIDYKVASAEETDENLPSETTMLAEPNVIKTVLNFSIDIELEEKSDEGMQVKVSEISDRAFESTDSPVVEERGMSSVISADQDCEQRNVVDDTVKQMDVHDGTDKQMDVDVSLLVTDKQIDVVDELYLNDESQLIDDKDLSLEIVEQVALMVTGDDSEHSSVDDNNVDSIKQYDTQIEAQSCVLPESSEEAIYQIGDSEDSPLTEDKSISSSEIQEGVYVLNEDKSDNEIENVPCKYGEELVSDELNVDSATAEKVIDDEKALATRQTSYEPNPNPKLYTLDKRRHTSPSLADGRPKLSSTNQYDTLIEESKDNSELHQVDMEEFDVKKNSDMSLESKNGRYESSDLSDYQKTQSENSMVDTSQQKLVEIFNLEEHILKSKDEEEESSSNEGGDSDEKLSLEIDGTNGRKIEATLTEVATVIVHNVFDTVQRDLSDQSDVEVNSDTEDEQVVKVKQGCGSTAETTISELPPTSVEKNATEIQLISESHDEVISKVDSKDQISCDSEQEDNEPDSLLEIHPKEVEDHGEIDGSESDGSYVDLSVESSRNSITTRIEASSGRSGSTALCDTRTPSIVISSDGDDSVTGPAGTSNSVMPEDRDTYQQEHVSDCDINANGDGDGQAATVPTECSASELERRDRFEDAACRASEQGSSGYRIDRSEGSLSSSSCDEDDDDDEEEESDTNSSNEYIPDGDNALRRSSNANGGVHMMEKILEQQEEPSNANQERGDTVEKVANGGIARDSQVLNGMEVMKDGDDDNTINSQLQSQKCESNVIVSDYDDVNQNPTTAEKVIDPNSNSTSAVVAGNTGSNNTDDKESPDDNFNMSTSGWTVNAACNVDRNTKLEQNYGKDNNTVKEELHDLTVRKELVGCSLDVEIGSEVGASSDDDCDDDESSGDENRQGNDNLEAFTTVVRRKGTDTVLDDRQADM